MNEYKRMAAILLILIFAIADLTLTVLKDFEESGIKRDRRYRADIGDTFAEQEDWNVDPEVTGEAVTDSPENTEETKPDIKKPESEKTRGADGGADDPFAVFMQVDGEEQQEEK